MEERGGNALTTRDAGDEARCTVQGHYFSCMLLRGMPTDAMRGKRNLKWVYFLDPRCSGVRQATHTLPYYSPAFSAARGGGEPRHAQRDGLDAGRHVFAARGSYGWGSRPDT